MNHQKKTQRVQTTKSAIFGAIVGSIFTGGLCVIQIRKLIRKNNALFGMAEAVLIYEYGPDARTEEAEKKMIEAIKYYAMIYDFDEK